MAVWEKFTTFLIGSKVVGYGAHGGTALVGGFTCLRTGHAEEAIEAVNDGDSGFAEALRRAMKDGDLKSTCFTLPLTVSGKRDRPSGRLSEEEPREKRRSPVFKDW